MQWVLRTRSTDYAVSVLESGSGLVLDHWGEGLDGPPAPWSEPERIISFAVDADRQPLEYASNGQRQVAFSELLVDRGGGRTGASWIWSREGTTFATDGGGDELTVQFVDETGMLFLRLIFATSAGHDVVSRRMSITNKSLGPLELSRVFSAGWNIPLGQRVRVDYLAGGWAREFQRESIDLGWGTFSIGSRHGATGLLFSPVVVVSAQDEFTEFAGRSYGVALEWSGSWRLQVESSSVGQHARVSCGIDDDLTTVTLDPGATFSTPASIGVFSSNGPEGVTAAWHEYQRTLARDLSPASRPVVYNSWYATEFDVTIEHQTALAEVAADLGVEAFVLDDGWFAGRGSDSKGLGDWYPDPTKFPDGVAQLADRVNGLGMRFGIWIEPECVNQDSDLFRQHPDWVYRAEGRPLQTVRNQYVLDLGRPEVEEWAAATLRRLLGSADITYLKWDMNRPIGDGGRPGDPHGREWSIQHTRAYYRLMRMLRDEFPGVTVEACSAGGGRIDNAVLALSDVVWTSDEVGPRDRLGIQDGFLSAYPAWVMSSWVADDAGHRDRRPTSLAFRFLVAMSGVLGIGSDLLRWDAGQRDEAARWIARYKGIRNVVQRGSVSAHGRPDRDLYATEFVGPADDPRVVVFVFDHDRDRQRDAERPRIRPAHLAEGVEYVVESTGQRVTRESARSIGIVVPFIDAADADLLILVPTSGGGSQ